MDSTDPPPEAGPSRIYREHLPLPEAITIRDGPYRSRRPLSSSQATHAPDHTGLGATRGSVPPRWDSYAAWREWNTNSVKHGPPELVNPPTFVPSTTEYDELGRSAMHGVEVDVTAGRVRAEGVEDGEKVAGWYRSLSTSTSRVPSRKPSPLPKVEPPDQSPSIAPLPDTSPKPEPLGTVSSNPSPIIATTTPPVLKVHSKEWFIRRALLTSHQRDPTSAPAAPKAPSSIGSLLNIPSQPKVTQAQYVLGPENRGYALLKDRLGWEGGGLGRARRAPDWVPAPAVSALPTAVAAPVIDENGVVDLTGLPSDDEAPENDDEVEIPGPGGPGRTAPIATTLKLDRLGLGHRRAAPREHIPSTVKKVTHTAAEILEAQRRSRMKPREGVELGKKAKIKWKVRDKRERDERRRLAAALNA